MVKRMSKQTELYLVAGLTGSNIAMLILSVVLLIHGKIVLYESVRFIIVAEVLIGYLLVTGGLILTYNKMGDAIAERKIVPSVGSRGDRKRSNPQLLGDERI